MAALLLLLKTEGLKLAETSDIERREGENTELHKNAQPAANTHKGKATCPPTARHHRPPLSPATAEQEGGANVSAELKPPRPGRPKTKPLKV